MMRQKTSASSEPALPHRNDAMVNSAIDPAK
jgi:hypothetical protein